MHIAKDITIDVADSGWYAVQRRVSADGRVTSLCSEAGCDVSGN